MTTTKTWHVEMHLDEEGDHTRSDAVLSTPDFHELRGTGLARRYPGDREVPEIGDKLAASRALADLAHQLLEAATVDVETNVGAPATLEP